MMDKNTFMADMLEQLNRLWNNGDLTAAAKILAPDFVRHEPSLTPIEGSAALGEMVLNLREQYPDLVITFKENIFDGKTMVTRWRFQGTDLGTHAASQSAPTGKKVDYEGVDILHIKDGKIAEDFSYFDQITILQQLGMLPQMG